MIVLRLCRLVLPHIHLLALSLVLTLGAFALQQRGVFRHLDWLLYDFSESLRPEAINDNTVLIGIDDLSIKQLGRWPWSRNYHAELVTALDNAGASLIVFDVLFADLDKQNLKSDRALKNAIQTGGNVVLPMHIERLGAHGQLIEVPPAEPFYLAAAGVGHVHVDQDQSGVTRGVFLKEGLGTAYWPHLSLVAAQLSAADKASMDFSVSTSLAKDVLNPMVIVRDAHRYIPSNVQPAAYFSYVDVLQGNVDHAVLKGKTVFIGATATGIGDRIVTPVGSVFGVEFNLWVYHAISQGGFIVSLLDGHLVLSSVCLFFGLILLGRLSPRTFLLASCLFVVTLICVSSVLQIRFRQWLPVTGYVAAVFLFYPYWSWLRLEKAVSFLKRELIQLQSDSSLEEFSGSDSNDYERALHFLKSVGCVSSWAARSKPGVHAGIHIEHGRAVFESEHIKVHFSDRFSEYLAANEANEKNTEAMVAMWLRPNSQDQVAEESELVSRLIAQVRAYRKRYEDVRALHEQSLDKLQDGILIADVFGRIEYCNHSFASITGEKMTTSLLAALDAAAVPEELSWGQVIAPLYRGESFLSGTARGKEHDQEFLYQLRLARIFNPIPDTIIVSLTDISALRRAQREKEEALNFVSHDLRSPLVSVLALIERERAATNHSSRLSCLDDIEMLINKNLSYADGYLQLSKAKAMNRKHFVLLDAHSIMDQAYIQAMSLAKHKHVHVACHRCAEEAWLEGEASLLERMLLNLISNAFKYSEANATVELSLGVEVEHVVFSVRDYGAGIAEQDKQTLFERFRSGSSESNRQELSSGLGLYFVHTVVSAHLGSVQVSSAPGEGACFTVKLPRVDVSLTD